MFVMPTARIDRNGVGMTTSVNHFAYILGVFEEIRPRSLEVGDVLLITGQEACDCVVPLSVLA